MLQPLDGPALQDVITVDNLTVTEVKVSGTPMEERKVVTLQPDGKIRVYFGDAAVAAPVAATVAAKGFLQHKDTIRSYEAATTQPIYILAETGTVDVITAERA